MKKSIEFKNLLFSKKEIKDLVYIAFSNYGITKTTQLVDDLKDLGFRYATKAGISISIEDLKVPPTKRDFLRSASTTSFDNGRSYFNTSHDGLRFVVAVVALRKTKDIKPFKELKPLRKSGIHDDAKLDKISTRDSSGSSLKGV